MKNTLSVFFPFLAFPFSTCFPLPFLFLPFSGPFSIRFLLWLGGPFRLPACSRRARPGRPDFSNLTTQIFYYKNHYESFDSGTFWSIDVPGIGPPNWPLQQVPDPPWPQAFCSVFRPCSGDRFLSVFRAGNGKNTKM